MDGVELPGHPDAAVAEDLLGVGRTRSRASRQRPAISAAVACASGIRPCAWGWADLLGERVGEVWIRRATCAAAAAAGGATRAIASRASARATR